MVKCKSFYDLQEDSYLLERWVRKYANGKVLDIGTGSGIQAIAAAQSPQVESVLAVDVHNGVIGYCNKNIKNPKIKFIKSDLFENVRGKFDAIIFNPPYLPQALELRDMELEGGKKGFEVIEKFLNNVNNFLEKDGIALMIFSSLTRKEKVDEFIANNLLEPKELERLHVFFEDIYAYLLEKNEFLKELEGNKISRVQYFTKGHRGILYTGIYKNKKIVIKAKNPKSNAFGRIQNESKWLKKLNKCKIGPKLVFSKEEYLVYEYINGDFIADYIKKSNKSQIKKIIKEIFNQSNVLDKIGADKEEMHHPLKHVIVRNHKPVMLDFERMHFVKDPKNVTQFCQFLMNSKLNEILKTKKISIDRNKIMDLAKIYKRNMNISNLNKIINSIK